MGKPLNPPKVAGHAPFSAIPEDDAASAVYCPTSCAKSGIEELLLQHRRVGQECNLLRREQHRAERLADLRGVKRNQSEIIGADRGKSSLLPPCAFIGEVIKSLVLLDRPADRRSRLHPRVRRIGNRAERIDRLEIAIPQIAEERTVQVIRSRSA